MASLSFDTKEKMISALRALIENVGKIEDSDELHEKAVETLSEYVGDKPLWGRALAEAFNSQKTISKLSRATSADRDKEFALLDPLRVEHDLELLNKKACRDALKESIKGSSVFEPTFKRIETPIRKAAAEKPAFRKSAAPVTVIEEPDKPMSVHDARFACEDAFKQYGEALSKYAAVCQTAYLNVCKAFDDFVVEFNTNTNSMKKTAASLISGKYGSFGDRLIRAFNNERPNNKVTYIRKQAMGTLCFPEHPIYKKAEAYLNSVKDLLHKRAFMEAQLTCGLRVLKQIDCKYLKKRASTPEAAAYFLTENTGDILGLTDKNVDSVIEELKTANLKNALQELETNSALISIMNDPYIKGFSPDKIVDAYNETLQLLPSRERKHPANQIALLKSWVAERLGRGNVPSASDQEKIVNILKATPDLNSLSDMDFNPAMFKFKTMKA